MITPGTVAIGERIWRAVAPVKRIKKALNRRRARLGKPLLPITQEDETMQGYKTYLGIATAALGFVLGLLGISDADASTLSAQIVGALDQILTVGGLAFAAYGRAKAKPAA